MLPIDADSLGEPAFPGPGARKSKIKQKNENQRPGIPAIFQIIHCAIIPVTVTVGVAYWLQKHVIRTRPDRLDQNWIGPTRQDWTGPARNQTGTRPDRTSQTGPAGPDQNGTENWRSYPSVKLLRNKTFQQSGNYPSSNGK